MARVITHVVLYQAAQGIGCAAAVDIDRCLALAHAGIGAFEHGAVKLVLAFEIVVDLALGRLARDLVDPRPGQPLLHELVRGDVDDLVDRLLAAFGPASARGLCCRCRLRPGSVRQGRNLRNWHDGTPLRQKRTPRQVRS